MSKVLLTIEQVRFIWSLGFTSGRVQQASHPNQGVTWEEESPVFESDLIRVASTNKQLSRRAGVILWTGSRRHSLVAQTVAVALGSVAFSCIDRRARW